jgi:hypothetical protein
MTFKSFEGGAFLKSNHGGTNILEKFLTYMSGYSRNSYQLEVFSLKCPYKEFAWLFTKITKQESMNTIPKYVLYVIHHLVHEDSLFEWAHIILSEVSFQLGNF